MVRVKWANDIETAILHYWTVVYMKVKAWYDRFVRTICPPEEYGTANGTAKTLGFKLPVCNVLRSPAPVVTITATKFSTLTYKVPEVNIVVFPPWPFMLYFGFFMLAMTIGYGVLAVVLLRLLRRSRSDDRQARRLSNDKAYEDVNAIVDAKMLNLSSIPYGPAAESGPKSSPLQSIRDLPLVPLEQVTGGARSEVDNSITDAVESKWTSIEQSLFSRMADKVQTMISDALPAQVAGAIELKWTSAEQSLVPKIADKVQSMINDTLPSQVAGALRAGLTSLEQYFVSTAAGNVETMIDNTLRSQVAQAVKDELTSTEQSLVSRTVDKVHIMISDTLPSQVQLIAADACETLMDEKTGLLKLDIQKSTMGHVDELVSKLRKEILVLQNSGLQLQDEIKQRTKAMDETFTKEVDARKQRDLDTDHSLNLLSQNLEALNLRHNQLAADLTRQADAENSSGPEFSSISQRLVNLQAEYAQLRNSLEKEQNHRREIQARYGLRQFRRRSPPKVPTANMEERSRKRSRSVARMGFSADDIAFRSQYGQSTSLQAQRMLPDGKRLRATHYPYGDYQFSKIEEAEVRPSAPSAHRNRRRRGGQRKQQSATDSFQGGDDQDAQRSPNVLNRGPLSTPEDPIDQFRRDIGFPTRAVGVINFIKDLKKWQNYAASMTGQLQEKETHQLARRMDPGIDLRRAPNMASLRREFASRQTKEVKATETDANVKLLPDRLAEQSDAGTTKPATIQASGPVPSPVERPGRNDSPAVPTNPGTATDTDGSSTQTDSVPRPSAVRKPRAPLVPQLPLQERSSLLPRPLPPPPQTQSQSQTIVSRYAVEADTPIISVAPKPESAPAPKDASTPVYRSLFAPAIDSKWASALSPDDGQQQQQQQQQDKPHNAPEGRQWRGGRNRGRRGWGP